MWSTYNYNMVQTVLYGYFTLWLLYATGNCAVTTRKPIESTEMATESTQMPVESTKMPVESNKMPTESNKMPTESTEMPIKDCDNPEEDDPTTIAGLFEGDIENVAPGVVEGIEFRNLVMPHKVWPNHEIPVKIDDKLFSESEKKAIQEAIDEIHSLSCVRFIPYNGHSEYVDFFKGKGCSSDVGFTRKRQILSLGVKRCFRKGVIMHELLHTTGFWHEQSREDRDNYVEIDWRNIREDDRHNFKKYTWATIRTLGENYDYDSLMHYGPFAFAKNRKRRTISPKTGQVAEKMGQRNALSEVDIRKLNKLYDCDIIKDLYKE